MSRSITDSPITLSTNTINPALQGWQFDNSYVRLPSVFYCKTSPIPVAHPQMVIFNETLAETLGLQVEDVESDALAIVCSGNQLPLGAEPIAQAYAGHQFGHFTMLGDGRAHLIGEQITPDQQRYDIQLKGSGKTPYSRNGDGRAALQPMLREYIISEAMHALGISTTRSLAVVTTGEPVFRETTLPGAILTRVASSHLRVGTFEYIADKGDVQQLQELADYAIERHYPHLKESDNPYMDFLRAVMASQAKLVASWLHVGFIHGVMNTDNMTISGETIDYGPCAFMDAYDPATVFSSIDVYGRYAYANQPVIAQWNLARLAETLLPLLDTDMHRAVKLAEIEIHRFQDMFQQYWFSGMRRKLGLVGEEPEDTALIGGWLQWMQSTHADYTQSFRALATGTLPHQEKQLQEWYQLWQGRRLRQEAICPLPVSNAMMREHNPAIIPRNYQVEKALTAAQQGNLSIMHSLLNALKKPYEEHPDFVEFQLPPPSGSKPYKTFCGT